MMYVIAIWCMFFMDILIDGTGICRLFSSLTMFVCMAHSTPTMMTLSGWTIHPYAQMALISG